MSDHTRADEGEGREPSQDDLAARFALEERAALPADLAELAGSLSGSGRDDRAETVRRAIAALTRLNDRAAQAEAEVARLQERVAVLEAALQPFANYAADMPGADFGEGEIGEYYHDGFRRSIRTQDLRAARTALEAPHEDN